MRKFYLISNLVFAALLSCQPPFSESPILQLQPAKSGNSILVLVSPSRGPQAMAEVDEDRTLGRELLPGGSLVFELKPGAHQLTLTVFGQKKTMDFRIGDGQTISLA